MSPVAGSAGPGAQRGLVCQAPHTSRELLPLSDLHWFCKHRKHWWVTKLIWI